MTDELPKIVDAEVVETDNGLLATPDHRVAWPHSKPIHLMHQHKCHADAATATWKLLGETPIRSTR
jgi:hypothetical protein